MTANILVLAAGRRVELVRAFQAACQTRQTGGRVLTTDLNPALASACQVSDGAFPAPRGDSSGYADHILGLCRDEGVAIVVPTIDTDLLTLATHRERFADAGVVVVISDAALVAACRDKRRTSEVFHGIDLATPEIYSRDAIRFPCFAKPYDGSASVGAVALKTQSQLTETLLANEKLMFMEYVDSTHLEFTVDCYYDRAGALKALIPRQRLEVRAGEVSKGVTRRGRLYDYLLPRMRRLAGARGCITLQLFADARLEAFYGIEINPRFGGGFPLTEAAGADFPGWLIDEHLLGRDAPFFDAWEENLLMLRYDAKVLVHGHE